MPSWCRARGPRARRTRSRHPLATFATLNLLLAALGSIPLPARAHSDPAAPVPAVQALQTDAPMRADGILDEPFWEQTPQSSGFIDQRTGQPAAEQTVIRVAYTTSHLYLAVECYDSQIDQLRATERREDRDFVGDDWVEIHVDPPHTHRTKYAFFSNPLGTRSDANEGPSGVFNRGWSADWDLGAHISSNRWTFEMSIPFTILNYERRNGQSWGFNVTRQLRRTDVLSFWSFSATEMYKPRHFGHLTHLDLAESVFDRNWEVTPYASVRTDFNGDVDTFLQAGIDVSARLTPSITAALTLNPDFGQVEADTDTIELRDTERFLPEKRPFFREGTELIRMPHQLYYSRRFSDIDAGLNVSGLWHGLSFSALNVQGDIARNDNGDGHPELYYGNSTVLRVLQNVGERSSLGYFASGSALEEGPAVTGGLDGYFFLTPDWRVSLQAAGSGQDLTGSPDNRFQDRQDYLGYGTLIYERYPWSFNAGYTAISEFFNPLLGYIPRRNIFGPTCLAQINPRTQKTWYKEYRLTYDSQFFDNSDGDSVLRDHHASGFLLLASDIGLRLGQAFEYHAPYDNRRTSAGISLFTSDLWKSASIGWGGGLFELKDYNEFTLSKPLKPWERLPIRWDFTVRLERDRRTFQEQTVWLNQVVFDLYLAKDMWLKSSFQHRSDDQHNISLIYGWQFLPRTWWYLVYNGVRNADEDGNSLFSKITYTF